MYRIYQVSGDESIPVLLVDQKISLTKQPQTMPFIVFSLSEAQQTVESMNKKCRGLGFRYQYKMVEIVDI